MLEHDRLVALDRVGVRHAARQLDAADRGRVVEPDVARPARAERDLDRPGRLAVLEEEGEAASWLGGSAGR
jgi:hypothetical protein